MKTTNHRCPTEAGWPSTSGVWETPAERKKTAQANDLGNPPEGSKPRRGGTSEDAQASREPVHPEVVEGGTRRAATSSAAFSGARMSSEHRSRPLNAGSIVAARQYVFTVVEMVALRPSRPRSAGGPEPGAHSHFRGAALRGATGRGATCSTTPDICVRQPSPATSGWVVSNSGKVQPPFQGFARLRFLPRAPLRSALGYVRSPHRGCGFSLIELLVVITILGVLASLLLPSLSKAKAKTHQTVCGNNLGQMARAWLMYVDDHQGFLPPNASRSVEFEQISTPGSWVVGNAKVDTNTAGLEAGVLWSYLKSARVYRCPADRSTVLDTQHLPRNRSYSMSLWLSPDMVSGTAADLFSEADRRKLARFSTIERHGTSHIWVFIEEHPVSLDDGVFIINGIPTNHVGTGRGRWWASFPGTLHQNAANLSFADGHVEPYRWQHHRKPTRYTGGPTPTVNDADFADLENLRRGLPSNIWESN